jgi:putative transcriptional regulator
MRTVVYLLRHDQEGALGLILNRPKNQTVGEMFPEISELSIDADSPMFYGGPVDGPVMLLQACRVSDEEGQIMLVACDQDRIAEAISGIDTQAHPFRVFEGHSGWGPLQLESEMAEGSWHVWDIMPEQLLAEPDELWELAIREIGHRVVTSGIPDSLIPENPMTN